MRQDRPTPADVIATYRLTPRGDRELGEFSRGSPGSELLASRDAEAYAEYLCASPLCGLIPGSLAWWERPPPGGELRGLVLRGGGGGAPLPPDNPWRLPPTPDLGQAIRDLWAPAAGCLPGFLDILVTSVFALAMIRYGDRDLLAYLVVHWVSSDVRDAVATATIEQLMDARKVTVAELWGSAPLRRSDERAVSVLGATPSAPLRALASVHGSIILLNNERYVDLENIDRSYADWLRGPGNDLEDEQPASVPDGNYVFFASYNSVTPYLLDLDVRDETDNPTVVPDGLDGPYLHSRKGVPEFFAETLPEMLDDS